MSGIDKAELPQSVAATADQLVMRDGNGVAFAAQHAALGAAGAAGAVIVADATGKVPAGAIPGGGGGSSTAAFAQLAGVGDVAAMAGRGGNFHTVKGAKTLQTAVFTIGTSAATGSVVFDVFKNGVTIFPGAKPTVACNGGRAKVKVTPAVAFADLDDLEVRVVSAPSGCTDYAADMYDS